MKRILAIICSTACIFICAAPGNAAQWLFSGSDNDIAAADGKASETFATVLATSSDTVEVFSGTNFAPFIPMQLDRFAISLISSPSSGEFSKNSSTSPPRLQLSTGVKTENYLAEPPELIGDNLLEESQSSDYEFKSSVLFVGLGIDFNSGYLKGNAFIGRALDGLSGKFDPDETAGNQHLNTDSYGFEASAGYQLNDSLSLSGGIGRMTDKNEETAETENVYAVYAQAILAVAPGVQVKPEVGQMERVKGKTEPEEIDESFYAGAVWEINF